MKHLFLILCLFLSGCAGSFSDFSQRDLQYQAASTVLTIADWNQTLQFSDNDKVEQNPILGANPTEREINTIIPLAIAGQWLTSWALPTEARFLNMKYNPRRLFQIVVISGEAWAVNNNYQIGIKVKF